MLRLSLLLWRWWQWQWRWWQWLWRWIFASHAHSQADSNGHVQRWVAMAFEAHGHEADLKVAFREEYIVARTCDCSTGLACWHVDAVRLFLTQAQGAPTENVSDDVVLLLSGDTSSRLKSLDAIVFDEGGVPALVRAFATPGCVNYRCSVANHRSAKLDHGRIPLPHEAQCPHVRALVSSQVCVPALRAMVARSLLWWLRAGDINPRCGDR